MTEQEREWISPTDNASEAAAREIYSAAWEVPRVIHVAVSSGLGTQPLSGTLMWVATVGVASLVYVVLAIELCGATIERLIPWSFGGSE